jgi:hypothetical protein
VRALASTTLVLLLLLAGCSGDDAGEGAGGDAAPGEQSVAFGGIEDGAEVTSPVAVDFEAEGFTIEPAGDGAITEGAGHMHVMVDTGCVEVGQVIPSDEQHLHFGDGSTSAELELEPGEHTLCLQAGDGAHTALDLTDEITITVVGA